MIAVEDFKGVLPARGQLEEHHLHQTFAKQSGHSASFAPRLEPTSVYSIAPLFVLGVAIAMRMTGVASVHTSTEALAVLPLRSALFLEEGTRVMTFRLFRIFLVCGLAGRPSDFMLKKLSTFYCSSCRTFSIANVTPLRFTQRNTYGRTP